MQTLKEYYSDPNTVKRLIERFRNMTMEEFMDAGYSAHVNPVFFNNVLDSVGYSSGTAVQILCKLPEGKRI